MPGLSRFWYAPTLLWLGADRGALTLLVVCGSVGSLLLLANVWPRVSILVAFVAFLSFIGVSQDFGSYQSDGMLLEAAFLSLFYAPPGARPGLGAQRRPSRAAGYLLLWEWFRIYFGSGVVKLASGDPTWRDLTAMDTVTRTDRFRRGLAGTCSTPVTGLHATTVAVTLIVELALVWLVFLGRRARLVCFVVVTTLQVGIIATANYAFLNYLVLSLGFLLLDDAHFEWIARRFRLAIATPGSGPPADMATWRLVGVAVPLTWVFYATCADVAFADAPPPSRRSPGRRTRSSPSASPTGTGCSP